MQLTMPNHGYESSFKLQKLSPRFTMSKPGSPMKMGDFKPSNGNQNGNSFHRIFKDGILCPAHIWRNSNHPLMTFIYHNFE